MKISRILLRIFKNTLPQDSRGILPQTLKISHQCFKNIIFISDYFERMIVDEIRDLSFEICNFKEIKYPEYLRWILVIFTLRFPGNATASAMKSIVGI